MLKKEAIFVFSASVKKDKDSNWVSSGLNDNDFGRGAPGGKLRIISASYLYFDNQNYLIIVSGGRGWDIKNDEKSRPNLSEIMERELIELGVPESKILKEDKSNKTFEQILALEKIIKNKKLSNLIIISSRYHLPRIREMIKSRKKLKLLLENRVIKLKSAESICLKYDFNRWKKIIDRAYNHKEMKKIISLEKRGIKQIKEGTYNY